MTEKDPKRFYVYLWLRSKDSDRGPRLSPYYVGKGQGNRWIGTTGRAVNRPVDKSYIVFVQEGLTEQEAFDLEKYCIALYGRIDNQTGILHNKTDGGEGASGMIVSEWQRQNIASVHRGKPKSPEQRVKMSRSQKGRRLTREHRQKLTEAWKTRSHDMTEDQKDKLSKALKGQKKSDETRRKMSTGSARFEYELVSPCGDVYVVQGLNKFSEEHGLSPRSLLDAVKGKTAHHMGWTGKVLRSLKPSAYELISPSGKIYQFSCIGAFAKEHGLNATSLGDLVKGKKKQHKGWTGRIVEKLK